MSDNFWGSSQIKSNPIDWDVSGLSKHGNIDNATGFSPIIWFGLPDEEPLEKWTIDPYNIVNVNDELLFHELEYSDVIGDDPLDCVGFWANECGIYLPNMENLLISCPIKIHKNMSQEELILSVNRFFRRVSKPPK